MNDELFFHVSHNSSNELIPLQSYLFNTKNAIFLTGQINSEKASLVIQQIIALSLEGKPITMFITSGGGEISAGLAIMDAMESCGVPVSTVVVDRAYSMAAVIATSGKRRYILKNSKIFLHQPLIHEFGGNVSEVEKLSEEMKGVKQKINQILAANCKKTIEEVGEVTDKDTYFNAEEALKWNLVDYMVTDIHDVWEGEENV